MKRTALNVLEAERIAALATMPSEELPEEYDKQMRHELFVRMDLWTTRQGDKGIPFDRAPAFVLLAIRPLNDVPNDEMRAYIRNLSNVLGTARDTQLVIDFHEFYKIGDPPPHPETLLKLLAHQVGDPYPSHDFPFTAEQKPQWDKALERARKGTLKPRSQSGKTDIIKDT